MPSRRTGRRRLFALAGAALIAASVAAPAAAAPPQGRPASFWLTILHNNDGESKLLNAGSGALADYGGIARFKTLVDQLKYEATEDRPPSQRGGKRGVVMLSSGDNFLAGAQWEASLRKGVPYYDSIGLDLVGYDAMAVGNHEFDFTPEITANFIEGFESGVPFVTSNLDFSGEPDLQALWEAGRIVPATIVKEKGELIGIVGATTPQIANISSPGNVVADPDVAEAIQMQVDDLEARGVNKIILISHLQNVAEDRQLATMLDGIDVMIAGGGDEFLANPGDLTVPGDVINPELPYPLRAQDINGTEVPVITTAGDYKYVGRLSVAFDRQGNVVDIDEATSGPVRVSGTGVDAVSPDPDVMEQVVDPVTEFIAGLAANVIGTSSVPLNGLRGSVTADANQNILTAGVRNSETNLGNMTADSMLWQAQRNASAYGVDVPQVGLQNGGGIRNNSVIPTGNITELDTFSILSFSNFVSIKEDIPAEWFKRILETSVSEIGNGRFGQWAGVTFTYDPTAQKRVINANTCVVSNEGARVKNVSVDGVQIYQDGVFVGPPGWTVDLATNDFTFNGGDCFDFGPGGYTRLLGVTYQEALYEYIVTSIGDGGLGGVIAPTDYPVGGEGRIVRQIPI